MEISRIDWINALDYNMSTGEFTWRETRGKAKKGDIAGTPDKDGYIQIRYKGKAIQAHRLAWLIVKGYDPPEQIDHINHITNDNRFDNLRMATPSQNMRNRKTNKDNASGTRGVYWNIARMMWKVEIKHNKVSHYLGYYSDYEEACKVAKDFRLQNYEGFHND
jgi:hypothetical protein